MPTRDDHRMTWTNTKTLKEFDPPLAVERLVYEVKREAFERWQAVELEMWTKGEADRFPFFLGKETWLQKGEDVYRVSVVIYWESIEAWQSIDPAWLDQQEAAFAEAVGADNVKLVYANFEHGEQYYKISEYR
jgi:uncharacterized protein (TIGR03792 family)